jgi:hypothetical protein
MVRGRVGGAGRSRSARACHMLSVSLALALAATLATMAFLAPADAVAQSCHPVLPEMPCLTTSPAEGPIGTTVTLTGHAGRHNAEWKRFIKRSPGIGLVRDVIPPSATRHGCETVDGTRANVITVAADGSVHGTFVVARRSRCAQSDRWHRMTPGLYHVAAGCPTCYVGVFRVTRGNRQSLASTGFAPGPCLVVAIVMILVGLGLDCGSRRRLHPH